MTLANWSADAQPTINDTAIVNNGGTVQIDTNSPVGNYGELRLGETSGGSGTVDFSYLFFTGSHAYLGAAASSRGTVNMSGGTWRNYGGLWIGYSGTGALDLSGGSLISGNATIASQAGSRGSVTISSGTWTNNGNLSIASSGTATLNLSGGRLATTQIYSSEQINSHATINITGGTLSTTQFFHVGFNSTATLNLSNALLDIGTGIASANTVNGHATVTISGSGVLSATTIGKGSGTATLALDGGTLRAKANNNDFLFGYETGDITLLAGGGTIDTGTNAITIGTGFSGSGTLYTEGTGRLTVTGSSAHTGGTVINSGTISVANNAALGTGTTNIRDGQLFIQQSFRPQNDITLSGGSLAQEFFYGDNIAGAIDATSDLAGGRDTHAIILESAYNDYAILETFYSATSGASNDDIRVSDVLHLSGLQLYSETATAPFILQLTIETPTPEAFLARLDENNEWALVGLPDLDETGQWTGRGYAGTFEQFRFDFTDDLYNYFGIWGFTDTTVWALLDQNGAYAVASTVPEPSTWALLALGTVAILFHLRRHFPLS